jgi:O-acetyl-ADP-ribose deacetylase (regulator of RNase III)
MTTTLSNIKLILVDPNYALSLAFKARFDYLPNVEIANCDFEQLPSYDCLVSPANSFGMMDGGVDAAITKFFGISLMERVQQKILDDYLGEQSVGTSFIIATGHPQYPFLAHTPTMRVPMQIVGTDIPYIAMWAMLLAVEQHNRHHHQKIATVACPGLGTGIGRIAPDEAARQMALAYDHFLYPPKFLNCFVAASRQLQIWEPQT